MAKPLGPTGEFFRGGMSGGSIPCSPTSGATPLPASASLSSLSESTSSAKPPTIRSMPPPNLMLTPHLLLLIDPIAFLPNCVRPGSHFHII
ncbi:UNVERIFIED_CONTAM: hypothetical protein Sradi_1482900 [Sesamum radiatum]|uniref:Uncharacterized protein n=1 Tax=Sesamum radiatum TaxID=300843 RepID=A0AAW2U7B5_SESRA